MRPGLEQAQAPPGGGDTEPGRVHTGSPDALEHGVEIICASLKMRCSALVGAGGGHLDVDIWCWQYEDYFNRRLSQPLELH